MGKLIDLTGKRFERLLVLQRAQNKGKEVCWLCQCDCGNQKIVTRRDLQTGHTKSCGCLKSDSTILFNQQTKKKDIIGQRFGKLVVLEEIETREEGKVVWKCKCDCGTLHFVRGDLLRSGAVNSCGCLRSKGEELIATILSDNNIPFEKEKSFSTCRSPISNSLLYFDFYVNQSYIIEFDGIQHFKDIKFFGELKNRQNLDEYKNNWCKENNIALIRIPYDKIKNLNFDDLQPNTSKFKII